MQKKTESIKEYRLRVQHRIEDITERLEDISEQNKADLNSSRKSDDTDDPVDKYFHEPIAMFFSRRFIRLGVSPNAVTILSMVFGVSGGILFFPSNRLLNLLGIVFQIFAAILDCSDGQVARMTGKSTQLGRVLDGTVDGLNFGSVYIAIALRMMKEPIPFMGATLWKGWIWPVVLFTAVISHSSQARMADYYRVVHLFFKKGNDLPRSTELFEEYKTARKTTPFINWSWQRFYCVYTKLQEKSTPRLQRLLDAIGENDGMIPYGADRAYSEQSHRIIQMTNLLTFCLRAYLLYFLILAGWYAFYFPFVIVVMGLLKHDMIRRYEKIADDVFTRFFAEKGRIENEE